MTSAPANRGLHTGRDIASSVWQDAAYAVRQFRRAPLFTAGIVLTLGFGIGACATVYSWMAGVILRPLPAVPDAERLITARPEERNGFSISVPEYQEWRDQAMTVSGLAAASMSLFAVETGARDVPGSRTPLYGMFVSGNYFSVLGVPAWKGRTFTAADDVEGAPPVAVISHAAWQTHFGAAPDVVGRATTVNGALVTIVGVAPRHFGGTLAVARFDLWVPLSTRAALVPYDGDAWKARDWRWLDGIGRLRQGVTVAQANAEFQRIASRQAETYVENTGRGARVTPLDLGTASELAPLFVVLIAITVLVVLLICSNVANLLLTRATARDRELAVRLSLGASRGRIVRQLMTESVALALMGGAVGVVVAAFGDNYLALLMPKSSVPLSVPSRLDAQFVAFVLGVTGVAVLAFGLAPALFGSRIRLVEAMKNGAGGSTARGARLRGTLVVAQFALALSVLVCTALLVRRDRDVNAMDLGYRQGDEVLIAQTEMSMSGYADVARWRESIERARESALAVAGVQQVAVASFIPLSIVGYVYRNVVIPGRPVARGSEDRVLINGVGPGYFDLMGIELVAGREFNSADGPGQRAVVIVNESFTETYFRGRPPLNQTFTLGGRAVTIVGVARNGRYDYRNIDDARIPIVYHAWAQEPTRVVALHLRTTGDPMRLADDTHAALRAVDPAITLLPMNTLLGHAEVPFSISRSAVKILGVLGTAALLLASMGLFAVVSYGVSLRAREIGIRLAVGATRQRVMSLVLRGAVRLAAIGAVAGIASAIALATVLRNRIAIIPKATLVEFAVPTLVLAACAIVAGLLPARRAASVDPSRTLRSE